ncbi:MAG: hypothetical protein IKD27_04260 [Oscillospiraceae bacterium]|nr:hypothetical protein [Oscillospiraceae bacterium]
MGTRLTRRTEAPKGRNAATLRNWATAFLAIGIVGRSILFHRFLGLETLTGDTLMAALETDGAMIIAGAAFFCCLVESCAVPLFAFLLIEGFLHTSSVEKYLLRVGAVALVSELPYNFAMTGRLWDMGSRNPAIAMFLSLVMLFLWERFEGKNIRNILMRVLIFVAAFLWCKMLRIDHGVCIVIFAAMLWFVREKSNFRALFGFCAAMICMMFDLFYIGACLSCILLHRYNGERGEQEPLLNYAAYPALLLIIGILAKFL